MKTTMMAIGFALAAALFALGCGGNSVADNCADFCAKSGECQQESADEIAECRSECATDIESADNPCQDAFDDMTACVSGASCDDLETADACEADLNAFLAACMEFLTE